MPDGPQRVRIDGIPDAAVAGDDRGLAYGDGIFRTLCVRAGRIVAWSVQYDCLARDCGRLDLGVPDPAWLGEEVRRAAAGLAAAVVKIMVTRGSGGRGYTPPSVVRPRVIVSAHEMPARPNGPLALDLSPVTLAQQPLLAGVKHLNRLEQVLARKACLERACTDATMCDAEGRIIATTMRNLLFCDARDGWVTPDLSRCGVAGASRQRLMAHRAAIGRPVGETDIRIRDLAAFTAAIACNSVGGAIAVSRIGPQVFSQSAALAERADECLAATA